MAYSEDFYEALKGNDLKRAGFKNYYIPEIKKIFETSSKELDSVIDIGCGTGMLLSVFGEDIENICGIDFCDFSAVIEISTEKYIAYDLNKIDSLAVENRFDLACCLEVAEHLRPENAKKLVNYLTTVSDVVWFSAAVPFQCGEGHINEQWPEYWEKLFNSNEYVRVDYFRKATWDMWELPGYYRQNMLLYVKKTELSKYPILYDFFCNHNDDLPKHLIHPVTYMFSVNNYNK